VLRLVAALSAVYDLLIGAALLAGRPLLVQLFNLPDPVPPIHADLNGLFMLVIGAGYVLPFRDPARYRAYLWLMGPVLKGAGAILFVLDYLLRGSPASFLMFAAGDGSLAVLTLWALLKSRQKS
jgi:hypothetical protein